MPTDGNNQNLQKKACLFQNFQHHQRPGPKNEANTLVTMRRKELRKKCRFKSFWCHDVKRALILLKSLFFAKQVDFPRQRTVLQNILIWDMRISIFFPLFFAIARSECLYRPFHSVFLPFYLRYPLRFIFVLAAVKSWALCNLSNVKTTSMFTFRFFFSQKSVTVLFS